MIKDLVNEITKQLTDEGKLIAAGYAAFEDQYGIRNCSEEQRNDMRVAFFAGAQHLWGTVINILDPGTEPTDADLRRMNNINAELNKFVEFMKGVK